MPRRAKGLSTVLTTVGPIVMEKAPGFWQKLNNFLTPGRSPAGKDANKMCPPPPGFFNPKCKAGQQQLPGDPFFQGRRGVFVNKPGEKPQTVMDIVEQQNGKEMPVKNDKRFRYPDEEVEDKPESPYKKGAGKGPLVEQWEQKYNPAIHDPIFKPRKGGKKKKSRVKRLSGGKKRKTGGKCGKGCSKGC